MGASIGKMCVHSILNVVMKVVSIVFRAVLRFFVCPGLTWLLKMVALEIGLVVSVSPSVVLMAMSLVVQ